MRSALVLFLLLAGGGLTGCQTHDCDSSSVVVDDSDGGGPEPYNPGSGTWASAPGEGPWLDYPGGRTVTFKFPQAFRPANYTLQAWVSTDRSQGPGAGTSTLASGQLEEVTGVSPEGFSISNQSCAHYFLLVVVTTYPEGGATDAARD